MIELKTQIAEKIADTVKELYGQDIEVELTIPDPQFGDFSSNVAMQIAKHIGGNPREVAVQISEALAGREVKSEVAGPGFINITLSDIEIWSTSNGYTENNFSIESFAGLAGMSIVVEYSCPNYFKELHAGHLYQTLYGDVVARLLEKAGATVHRANFGADVGLSAARALWGIVTHIGGEFPERLHAIPVENRTKFIATSYVEGATADTSENEATSMEIMAINKRIYAMHTEGDTTSPFAQIYFTCREWCLAYFKKLYSELKVDDFEKFYPESSTEARGRVEVSNHVGTVFSESQGAVVYEGEKDGLHTRVFMTREGLPTYETKDLGLIFTEMDDFHFDQRILITGKEQSEYMKVVWQAADKIVPGTKNRMTHLTNGLIRFGDGKKMSSRTGNVTTAMDVIAAVRNAVGDSGDTTRDERIYLGALKYEFLKHRLGGDIAFDPDDSVSLQGNSGPYLQYAYVRAMSIMTKQVVPGMDGSLHDTHEISVPMEDPRFDESERSLARKLGQYDEVVHTATVTFSPHLICTYLYELAQTFNQFYESSRIIGSERQNLRWEILSRYIGVLGNGLELLGIQSPEKM